MLRARSFRLIRSRAAALCPMCGLVLLGLLLFAAPGCSTPPASLPVADAKQRAALAGALMQLSPEVETATATRLADRAFDLSRSLAPEMAALDPPIVLSARHHVGIKTPSFCFTWADRMYRGLRSEAFPGLALHAVMSPARLLHPLEHSAVLVTARGRPLSSGVVLDPCRREGRLLWRPAAEDGAFGWQPRDAVLWQKRFGHRPWYAGDPLDALIQTAPRP